MSGRTPAQCFVYQMQKIKVKITITRFVLSLYSAQVSKKTIIPSIPMIQEEQNWKKNHRREVKQSQKGKAFSHPSAKCSIF